MEAQNRVFIIIRLKRVCERQLCLFHVRAIAGLYKEMRALIRGLPPVLVRSLLLCACIDCVLLCCTPVLRNTVNLFVP